jgi:hypothetical protein
MKNFDKLLGELGVSKVRLAKYLGVSRQMVYNYLELEDVSHLPKEKRMKLFKLLDISAPSDIDKIKMSADYIMEVEGRLNQGVKATGTHAGVTFEGLNKKESEVLSNIMNLLKEKLVDGDKKDLLTTYNYLYHYLQIMDSSSELKYILAYFSKAAGFTKPTTFEYNKDSQFAFESILYSGMTLYNSGSASKAKLSDSHKKFVQEIEHKNEEKLSRTQELNTVKVQALKELNYEEITEHNAKEVFEKMAEIQSRKV